MSCEHEKRKKLPGLLGKTVFISKNREKTRFSSILDFKAPGADISTPNFVEQKLF
jgi:hypothetical protein